MGFKNDGLQVQEYVYDFDVDGGTNAAAITLSNKAGYAPIPVGAYVVAVHAHVVTAVTSGGSATVEWGNGDDADGYSGTAIAKATLVENYVCNHSMGAAALLWDNTNDNDKPLYIDDATTGAFKLLINTADLTAGKIVFAVSYYKMNV
jgi:hypothetical protein